jgi:hemolysin III
LAEEIRIDEMVQRSAKEEHWNVATHGIGALLAMAGLVWVCVLLNADVFLLTGVACVIYALLLVLMYVMSTLSHWFRDGPNQVRFRALDQAFIFLLIVGTYTPLSFQYWNTTNANGLLMAMWCIAIAGFIAKVFFAHRVNRVSVLGYLVLGWMPVLGLPFHDYWPMAAIGWVLAGGIVYSLGTIFLLNDRKAMWCHPLWHVSVIAASAIHFAAVVKFVVLA